MTQPTTKTTYGTTSMLKNPTDLLTATISFRLSEDEWNTLNIRADREHRTLSNLCRMLLRTDSPHA